MSAITFTLDFTGTPDADDILAARHIVRQENERRALVNVGITAENVRRAAQTPPLDPLPLLPILPTATGAQLKASYLGLLIPKNITEAHLDYIKQAKNVVSIAAQMSEAEHQQMAGYLQTRRNAGETWAQIVADMAS